MTNLLGTVLNDGSMRRIADGDAGKSSFASTASGDATRHIPTSLGRVTFP